MSQQSQLRDYRAVRLAWRALNRQLEQICARDGPSLPACHGGSGRRTNVPRARDSQQLEACAERMEKCRTLLRCLSPPVREALQQAPDPRTRQLVRLYYVQGRSVTEVAGRLGVSGRTVYRMLHRLEEGCAAGDGQGPDAQRTAQYCPAKPPFTAGRT